MDKGVSYRADFVEDRINFCSQAVVELQERSVKGFNLPLRYPVPRNSHLRGLIGEDGFQERVADGSESPFRVVGAHVF